MWSALGAAFLESCYFTPHLWVYDLNLLVLGRLILLILNYSTTSKEMACGLICRLVKAKVQTCVVHLLLIVEHVVAVAWFSLWLLNICRWLHHRLLRELVEIVSRMHCSRALILCTTILVVVWALFFELFLLGLCLRRAVKEEIASRLRGGSWNLIEVWLTVSNRGPEESLRVHGCWCSIVFIIYLPESPVIVLSTIWIWIIALRLIHWHWRSRILLFVLFLGRWWSLFRSIEIIKHIIVIFVIVLKLLADVTLTGLTFIIYARYLSVGLLLRWWLLQNTFIHRILLLGLILSEWIGSHLVRFVEIVVIIWILEESLSSGVWIWYTALVMISIAHTSVSFILNWLLVLLVLRILPTRVIWSHTKQRLSVADSSMVILVLFFSLILLVLRLNTRLGTRWSWWLIVEIVPLLLISHCWWGSGL